MFYLGDNKIHFKLRNMTDIYKRTIISPKLQNCPIVLRVQERNIVTGLCDNEICVGYDFNKFVIECNRNRDLYYTMENLTNDEIVNTICLLLGYYSDDDTEPRHPDEVVDIDIIIPENGILKNKNHVFGETNNTSRNHIQLLLKQCLNFICCASFTHSKFTKTS